ncbi:T9SS type A sorting domain-containing protein [Pontibacter akesuensis]|uniref:Por secretion system C-terminal sorting domain-containing protein n=1 Tax=Pontibacter akesuensis TaxID=388950 RepID=A0A1I7KI44_9BACT|nr:T9SS type A sorting domain-containing protein [Pontibacter akesuensis]GHA78846.1 hypothetical protein GCM10007389_36160 [Pontibacter akesuensis]SFU97108.1 Por secretion system C-terminal sorting domain-containing protein [Pontibacter akesuensis]
MMNLNGKTMNFISTLETMAKLALALLLALLPLHQLLAQESSSEKTKELRVKIVRELNGQTQVTDTVVQAQDQDQEVLINSLRALKTDTALARRLRTNLGGTFRFDTTVVVKDIKKRIYSSSGAALDTAEFRRLHGDKIKVYKLDKALNTADRQVFVNRIRTQDTTMYRRLQEEGAIFYLNGDSLKGIHHFEVVNGAETVEIGSGNPAVFLRAAKNKDGVFLIHRDSAALNHLNPTRIAKIVVQRGNVISLDSLRGAGVKKVQIKISKDKETGAQKVYKIDEQGNEVEMKGDYLKLDHGDARITIIMKARVEDITAADKEALKEAGASVETKPRNELHVEEISFYPNPNNGRFNLSFKLDKRSTTRVSVMDSQGKEVFVDTVAEPAGEYNRQIDLTPFGPGLYYLQIAQGKKYHTKRILVK